MWGGWRHVGGWERFQCCCGGEGQVCIRWGVVFCVVGKEWVRCVYGGGGVLCGGEEWVSMVGVVFCVSDGEGVGRVLCVVWEWAGVSNLLHYSSSLGCDVGSVSIPEVLLFNVSHCHGSHGNH